MTAPKRWSRVVALTVGVGIVVAAGAAPAQDAPPGTSSPAPHAPLQVFIDKSKVDLAGHNLEVKASHDLSPR